MIESGSGFSNFMTSSDCKEQCLSYVGEDGTSLCWMYTRYPLNVCQLYVGVRPVYCFGGSVASTDSAVRDCYSGER